MIGIYKITAPNGKIYIGQSINVHKRMLYHKRMFKTSCVLLYNSLKKYGVANHKFEVVCECSREELNTKERYYQELYRSVWPSGLNLILTEASESPRIMSDLTRLKISSSSTGVKKKPLSDETKEKLRRINLGKKDSQETKLKKSLAQKGRKPTDETLKKMSISQKALNKIISEEQKEKFRAKVAGRKYTEEEKKIRYAKVIGNKFSVGREVSKETRKRISQSKLGKKLKPRKK